jgi:hypothetical protein
VVGGGGLWILGLAVDSGQQQDGTLYGQTTVKVKIKLSLCFLF